MQQRVEILKALYRDARDPHPRRADRGADAAGGARAVRDARDAQRRGQVDHLHHATSSNEVLEIADRITVLRRGETVATVPREGATEASLAG